MAAPVLVIIPAFNEEANLGRVLGELRDAHLDCDVLVIDDGSRDRTGDIARSAGVTVLSHPINRGYGAALVSGYAYALGRGYRTVVQLDGDGQHDPAQVPRLVQRLAEGDADMVLGSRMLSGGGHVSSLPRLLGIRFFAWLGRRLIDRPVTDPTSGFSAMNRRALEFLVANTPPDYPDLNVLVALHRAGVRVVEVPVVMRPRMAGESQLRGLALLVYVPKLCLYLWQVYREGATNEGAGGYAHRNWRQATAWITVAYLLIGLLLAWNQTTLNDEGLLTHYWASWVRQDFLDVLFFQKLKPVLSILYALPSALGTRGTLMAHVLVSATAIPMMAAVSQALGQRFPPLVALIVATSPLFFFGGSAGFSNNDGIVGIALVLYLLCCRRAPLAAGLVAGMLPWVRAELGSFGLVLGGLALLVPAERRLLPGLALFPTLYWIGGAAYHEDALWLIHFPPSAPTDRDNPIWATQLIGLRYLLEPAIAVTPVAALSVLVRWRRLLAIERALLVFATVTILTIHVFPMFRIGNFGAAPRYLLHLLPALALLIGRALDSWSDEPDISPARWWWLAAASLWIVTRQLDTTAVLFLLAGHLALLLALRRRAGRAALAATILLLFAGPLLPLRTDSLRPSYLDAMLAWLEGRPASGHQRVYTNAHLLAPFLERRLPDLEVYDLATSEMAAELTVLSNPDNGQRERILSLCRRDLYGRTLLPPIRPDDLSSGALLAFRKDPRLPRLLADADWTDRIVVLVDEPDYQLGRILPPAGGQGTQ